MSELSVVVPVYNERNTVRRILERVLARPEVAEMLVVDDASTDGTREVLGELEKEHAPRMRLFLHESNRGKGAALRTAFRHVRGTHTIVQDADLEYDPADYARLLPAVRNGQADAVYGTRFHRVAVFSPHTVVNRALTWFSNLTTGLHLTDMETCYKLLPSEVLRHVPIHSDRFAFEPEITAKLVHLGCRIREVPISYRGRAHSEGKKIRWWDGVAAVVAILRYGVFGDGVRHALRVSKRR